MAITIHYRFYFRGDEAELVKKILWLGTEFLKLPVSKVHPPKPKRRGYEMQVEVGPGCEWFTVVLAPNGENEWRGRGFTKTAYAADPKTCHTTIIAMLDLCKQASMLESVEDESGFWEKRDPGIFQ